MYGLIKADTARTDLRAWSKLEWKIVTPPWLVCLWKPQYAFDWKMLFSWPHLHLAIRWNWNIGWKLKKIDHLVYRSLKASPRHELQNPQRWRSEPLKGRNRSHLESFLYRLIHRTTMSATKSERSVSGLDVDCDQIKHRVYGAFQPDPPGDLFLHLAPSLVLKARIYLVPLPSYLLLESIRRHTKSVSPWSRERIHRTRRSVESVSLRLFRRGMDFSVSGTGAGMKAVVSLIRICIKTGISITRWVMLRGPWSDVRNVMEGMDGRLWVERELVSVVFTLSCAFIEN